MSASFMLDRLVLGDRLAERLALLRVRGSRRRTRPGPRRTARAAMLMRPTSSAPRMQREPVAEPVVAAEHAVGADAVAVVDHLDGLDALVPELADVAARR